MLLPPLSISTHTHTYCTLLSFLKMINEIRKCKHIMYPSERNFNSIFKQWLEYIFDLRFSSKVRMRKLNFKLKQNFATSFNIYQHVNTKIIAWNSIKTLSFLILGNYFQNHTMRDFNFKISQHYSPFYQSILIST